MFNVRPPVDHQASLRSVRLQVPFPKSAPVTVTLKLLISRKIVLSLELSGFGRVLRSSVIWPVALALLL